MEDLIITKEKIKKAYDAGVSYEEIRHAELSIGQQYEKPFWLYQYAEKVIGGRWPEAEPYIMKDSQCAYWYAEEVIRGRWLEAEPYIMKDPDYAYCYARNIICGRWLEAEPYIMKNPFSAYWYARDIIRGRWPEAEQYIKKSPLFAYHYATEFICGRWPEAERYIKKSSEYAYLYAKDIIRGRWLEAEPYIQQDAEYWDEYQSFIDSLKIKENNAHDDVQNDVQQKERDSEMETKQIVATLGDVEGAKVDNPDFVTWNDDKPVAIHENEIGSLTSFEVEGTLRGYDEDTDELTVTDGILTIYVDRDGFNKYLKEMKISSLDEIYNEDIFNMKWEDFYWESDDERQNDEGV